MFFFVVVIVSLTTHSVIHSKGLATDQFRNAVQQHSDINHISSAFILKQSVKRLMAAQEGKL